ncbi:alpha/beta fold hydrolase [Leptolyngbya sp. GB1-A1]|uniref:alpha/beta fold hydrolase n=1 Tax=unclassified Leptolyngbya TaxID=2650499 RepID=UPI00329750C2
MTTQIPVSASAPLPIEFSTWSWQGHNICYTVQGEGVPLVLVHGFGASIGHWRKNIPVLAAGGYKVFALDLLGFGRSDKPIELTYELELWQRLLKEFWETHIQEPAVFVGNSIGALLCLMVLADYPEITRGGVLLNAAGGLNHRPEELPLPLRLMMTGFNKLVTSQLVGTFLFNIIRQKPRLRRTLRQVYRDRTAITDDLIDLLHEPSCHPNAQKVFAAILSAPPGPKPESLLPKITQPLLILWGEKDPWTPISSAKFYQDLAEEKEHVQFIPIPDTGHCPHDERPDLVNAHILNWLNTAIR